MSEPISTVKPWPKCKTATCKIRLCIERSSGLCSNCAEAELSRIRELLANDIVPHLEELREAFQRGALSSSDGQNGIRSNRNADLAAKLRTHLLPQLAEKEKL